MDEGAFVWRECRGETKKKMVPFVAGKNPSADHKTCLLHLSPACSESLAKKKGKMFRRPLASGHALRNTTIACAMRFGGHAPTIHDHSGSFTRPLTVDENLALEDQKLRTVSGIVPGKLFMRHWVAGEQATISIVNRMLSIATSFGIMIWAVGFSGFGISTYTAAHAAFGVYLVMWIVMHTHMLWLIPLFLGLTTAQILLN